MITRTEGRIGHPTEFVEYAIRDKRLRYVAQRGNSGAWFVYEVAEGLAGSVKTVHQFGIDGKEKAADAAFLLALRAEDRILNI
jgi:hypothetical protein